MQHLELFYCIPDAGAGFKLLLVLKLCKAFRHFVFGKHNVHVTYFVYILILPLQGKLQNFKTDHIILKLNEILPIRRKTLSNQSIDTFA